MVLVFVVTFLNLEVKVSFLSAYVWAAVDLLDRPHDFGWIASANMLNNLQLKNSATKSQAGRKSSKENKKKGKRKKVVFR